jgi:hypothetical protein
MGREGDGVGRERRGEGQREGRVARGDFNARRVDPRGKTTAVESRKSQRQGQFQNCPVWMVFGVRLGRRAVSDMIFLGEN